MREEVFVSALEDVELGVVEFGIVVHGAVPFPHEAAHSRAALRRELAVEDDDDALVWAGRDYGRFEEEVLHLLLLVEVQGSLKTQRPNQRLHPTRTGTEDAGSKTHLGPRSP